ncbi:MAG: ferrous iron transport protein B [Candidatus Promineifilaceae bacterium]|nr:ferrous iron transport protein B [Candidatus Promineifilaceae bacterium]
MSKFTIALAGNPNAGKSTIFNALTGLRQHTGNWPGKTVDRKVGTAHWNGYQLAFVDLPGTYSLTAYSPDEIVARDFLVDEHPDAVICVVDATNLERNLYLVIQLLELGVPVALALNMSDQARAKGLTIDTAKLSQRLGDIPVVPTTASRGEGLDQLLAATVDFIKASETPSCECGCQKAQPFQIQYADEVEASLTALSADLSTISTTHQAAINGYSPRWLALKLLEGERDIVQRLEATPETKPLAQAASATSAKLANHFGDDVDIITADYRYSAVSDIARQVTQAATARQLSLSDRLDRFLTNRLLGLPIFMTVMYLIFRLVIDVSAPFLDWVDAVINGPIATALSQLLTLLRAPAWLDSLVIDGIVAGVGGILTFVPGLVVLFFFLALLEDSGYMARAAFVMDRFMQLIGLHGKSVIPLMLGFGCAVPAIYATRTISSRRDRLLTALLIPFMSCSARLPVYVVFALAFFGAHASTVIWLMYVAGVIFAVLVGFVFSRTVLRPEEDAAFVLELPPYRMPTLRSLLLHTWENTRGFIKNAGTVILAVSIVLWFLLNLPAGVSSQQDSYYGRLSQAISPALAPAGFDGWETSGALITGFIAKELVVSTLAQVYTGVDAVEATAADPLSQQLGDAIIGFGEAGLDAGRTLLSLLPGLNLTEDTSPEDTSLSQALRQHFSPLSALAFLVFVLLYIPCMATIGAIKQEFGARWATASAVYQTAFAWLIAVLVYQGGLWLALA